MFIFLSKFLPLFIYPLGLAFTLLVMALIFHKKTRWQMTALLLAVVILWLGGNSWVAHSLTRSLEWHYLPLEELPHADVIVVLGGGTDSAQYPRSIVEVNGAGDRILYARWLYLQGVAPKLLLSGGNIPWMDTQNAPADDMAALLEMLGVPEEAIWLEPESLNTYENALFSREILDREGIDRIVLVTSALHMPRAVALFEHQDLEVIPAPTDYSITQERWDRLWEPNLTAQIFNLFPSVGNLEDTTVALKEYIGILVYGLRGWL